ncbi:SAM-dependent methyltransferase [Halobacteriales archaeon QH_2_65_14]|nr:MAG: SAM-dependent methyltransferase [Halobacteriales archaeon QH_2_65_14]
MSLLFIHEDREYLLSPGETLETDLGVLEVPEDVVSGDTVETHLGTEFTARKLRGPDLFHHLERTGAPMMPRDVGLILGHTGIESGDRVLDAGTGSGVLAAALGRVDAQVLSYEIDEEFADVARENMRLAGVDSVEVRTGDVTDHLADLSGFDVVTLDTEDAPAVVAETPDLLVRGGFVAVYSPFVEHTRKVVEAAREAGLEDIRTLETIQRHMDFDDRGSRPSTAGVGHTGYLTFARRP